MSKFDAMSKAYAEVKSELRDKILIGAEKLVEAQVDLLKSADARATGLLAVCAALATGGIAFAAGNVKHDDPVYWAAIAFIVSSLAATLTAVWAVWPCKIRLPGWEPRTFLNDIEAEKPIALIEGEMSSLLQRRIDINDRILLQLGWRARISYVLIGSIPFSSLAGWMLCEPPRGVGVLIITVLVIKLAYVLAEYGRSLKQHRIKFG